MSIDVYVWVGIPVIFQNTVSHYLFQQKSIYHNHLFIYLFIHFMHPDTNWPMVGFYRRNASFFSCYIYKFCLQSCQTPDFNSEVLISHSSAAAVHDSSVVFVTLLQTDMQRWRWMCWLLSREFFTVNILFLLSHCTQWWI